MIFSSIGVILFIAIVLAIVKGVYTTEQTEQALIVKTWTGDLSVDSDAGLSITNPITNRVDIVHVTQQNYSSPQDGNSKDNIQVTFEITVEYNIANVKEVYKKIGVIDNSSIERYISSYLSTSVDKVTNKYTYDEIKSQINMISSEVTSELNGVLPSDLGVNIAKVVVDSVGAPEKVETAIQEKLAAQQSAEASAYKVQQAESEAKAQRIKEESVSQEQQQLELCREAINSGNANSPACYFGSGRMLMVLVE